MSQIQSAALMLAGFTAAFALAVFAIWWFRRPRAEVAGHLPRAPREFNLPKLRRRTRDEDPLVEISPARLARVSGSAPLEPLTEIEYDTDYAPEAAPHVDAQPAEFVEPVEPDAVPAPACGPIDPAILDAMAVEVEQQPNPAVPAADDRVSLRLVPHIPPRDAIQTRSWLGGRPRLPGSMDWPLIDGQPGDFLAQICCADLPAELWSDLGPRSGWLAFFSQPDTGMIAAIHLADAGEPRDPPRALGSAYFGPARDDRFGDLASFAVRAFPEWPVDMVAVRPGDDDPRCDDIRASSHDELIDQGYDIADPAFHPFDWDMMVAMVAILEQRLPRLQTDPAPPADASDELALALAEAAETNSEVAAGVTEIAAIIRESAGEHDFDVADATAVMSALHAIKWTKVLSHPDPETGEDHVEEITLPLTRHHPGADLWVDDYLTILSDHAKHAWCADPDRLSAPARAHFEPRWRSMATREMASIGHAPFSYVHDFDDERDVVLIELPTSSLMSRAAGDGHSLVVTIAKAALAAGDFSKLKAQIGN